MVERTEGSLEEFKGEVLSVEVEENTQEDMLPQYHIQIKPLDRVVVGKKGTGAMHSWIRISGSATDSSVARGSILERYIEILEDLHGAVVKNMKTHAEVMKYMVGKKYLFKSKVLGKSFEKFAPASYWCPCKLL